MANWRWTTAIALGLCLSGCDAPNDAANIVASSAGDAVAAPTQVAPPQESELEAGLRSANSSLEHLGVVLQMAETMEELGYAGAAPASSLLVGLRHAKDDSHAPYRVAWRLNAWNSSGKPTANDLPISFMDVTVDGEAAGTVMGEGLVAFRRVAWDTVLTKKDVAGAAILEALDRLKAAKAQPFDGISWIGQSDLHAAGDYRLVAEFTEWPASDDLHPSGMSRLTVYVIYVQPGLDVDFHQVSGGGFNYRGEN